MQDLVAQVHPSEAHERDLACEVAPDEAQVVQVENRQVRHALEVHSSPVVAHERAVLGNP